MNASAQQYDALPTAVPQPPGLPLPPMVYGSGDGRAGDAATMTPSAASSSASAMYRPPGSVFPFMFKPQRKKCEVEGVEGKLPAFVGNLWSILNDPRWVSIIHWSADGKRFLIEDEKALSECVLPEYFNTINAASFGRQLNFYCFRRVDAGVPDEHLGATMLAQLHGEKPKRPPMEYRHKYFQRDQPQLLKKVIRKTNHRPASKVGEGEGSGGGGASTVARRRGRRDDSTDTDGNDYGGEEGDGGGVGMLPAPPPLTSSVPLPSATHHDAGGGPFAGVGSRRRRSISIEPHDDDDGGGGGGVALMTLLPDGTCPLCHIAHCCHVDMGQAVPPPNAVPATATRSKNKRQRTSTPQAAGHHGGHGVAWGARGGAAHPPSRVKGAATKRRRPGRPARPVDDDEEDEDALVDDGGQEAGNRVEGHSRGGGDSNPGMVAPRSAMASTGSSDDEAGYACDSVGGVAAPAMDRTWGRGSGSTWPHLLPPSLSSMESAFTSASLSPALQEAAFHLHALGGRGGAGGRTRGGLGGGGRNQWYTPPLSSDTSGFASTAHTPATTKDATDASLIHKVAPELRNLLLSNLPALLAGLMPEPGKHIEPGNSAAIQQLLAMTASASTGRGEAGNVGGDGQAEAAGGALPSLLLPTSTSALAFPPSTSSMYSMHGTMFGMESNGTLPAPNAGGGGGDGEEGGMSSTTNSEDRGGAHGATVAGTELGGTLLPRGVDGLFSPALGSASPMRVGDTNHGTTPDGDRAPPMPPSSMPLPHHDHGAGHVGPPSATTTASDAGQAGVQLPPLTTQGGVRTVISPLDFASPVRTRLPPQPPITTVPTAAHPAPHGGGDSDELLTPAVRTLLHRMHHAHQATVAGMAELGGRGYGRGNGGAGNGSVGGASMEEVAALAEMVLAPPTPPARCHGGEGGTSVNSRITPAGGGACVPWGDDKAVHPDPPPASGNGGGGAAAHGDTFVMFPLPSPTGAWVMPHHSIASRHAVTSPTAPASDSMDNNRDDLTHPRADATAGHGVCGPGVDPHPNVLLSPLDEGSGHDGQAGLTSMPRRPTLLQRRATAARSDASTHGTPGWGVGLPDLPPSAGLHIMAVAATALSEGMPPPFTSPLS